MQTELLDVVGSTVGETGFGEIPDPFVGVEFRGVRRKVLEVKSWHSAAKGADGIAAVNLAIIPEKNYWPAEVTQQVPQEVTHLCMLDVLRMEAPEESQPPATRTDRDSGDDRDLVPTIAMPEDRRLAARRPRPTHGGNQEEARLVDEDEMGPQPRSVFFTRGHSTRFQCSMAASSRSSARVSGFWAVQSSWCRSRPT